MSFTEVFLSFVPFIRRAHAAAIVVAEKQSEVNDMEEAKNVSFFVATFLEEEKKEEKNYN